MIEADIQIDGDIVGTCKFNSIPMKGDFVRIENEVYRIDCREWVEYEDSFDLSAGKYHRLLLVLKS
jgi:hypothetical protein